MRHAIVVCILHATAAKQADTLLLREDQCDDALFVAHWTHVPRRRWMFMPLSVSRRPTTLQ